MNPLVDDSFTADASLTFDDLESNRDALVDIHCHCLPGVDDGPQNLPDAIDLCHALVRDGVSHAVATPHMLGRYDIPGHLQKIRDAHQLLCAELSRIGLSLSVSLWAEIRMDERIAAMLDKQQLLTLGPVHKSILLELPDATMFDPLSLITQLAKQGLSVVIAHPERNCVISARPAMVQPWLQAGASLQITAGSLTGDFGPAVESAAWNFLCAGHARFVASDAHNTRRRTPKLSLAWEKIRRRLGIGVANALCLENPKHLLTGEPPRRGWRKSNPPLSPLDQPESIQI